MNRCTICNDSAIYSRNQCWYVIGCEINLHWCVNRSCRTKIKTILEKHLEEHTSLDIV